MKNEVDWRHIVAAVLAVGLILYGGYRLLASRPEPPNAKAAPGPNARMEDAPEHPPGATAPGTTAEGRPAGFPTAQ